MKNQVIIILMIISNLFFSTEKLDASHPLTVDNFDFRYSDPNYDPGPPPNCTYTVVWQVFATDGLWSSGWLSGPTGTYPGTTTWTMTGYYWSSIPDLTPGYHYQIVVRITRSCGSTVRYGYSNPLDMDDEYHLSPEAITVESF